ncbi:MAG: hypothetical protein N3A65_03570 [candidate division WOR-3 bacterium]|nr:hypothetical protein [candidate division WOR-3 bacterium]
MKIIISFIILALVVFNCTKKEELFFTHLYGWLKYDTLGGINGLNILIRDINPENTGYYRFRPTKTGYSPDSLPGFFEMDSVCYGTSNFQGSQIVAVLLDSTNNPGWPRQYWYLTLTGGVDTVELELRK